MFSFFPYCFIFHQLYSHLFELVYLKQFGLKDWKLEQNPVSGFLSLLRNVLHRHPRNTEQLLEGSNIAIIGSLMQKVMSTWPTDYQLNCNSKTL